MSTYVKEEPVRRRSSAWIFVLGILVVVGAVGGWYYTSTRPKPAQVVERDIVGLIPLNGEVVTPPSARADVFSPYRAPVDKVETSIGTRVHRGDVLVKLSFPSIQAAVDQSRQTVQAAETAFANAKRQYDAPIGVAERQAAAARASESSAANTDQGGQIVNPDQSQSVAAAQALADARADRDAALVPYQQQLDAARAYYQEVRSGAKLGLLRAPITGTVMALNAQPGKEVGADPKTPVATIINLDKLQVQAKLAPDQAGICKPRTPVVITFKEVPGKELEGKVARVTSQIESRLAGLRKEQQYVALIDFDNSNGVAKPGMKPNAALKTGEVKNALAVPAEAVETDSTGRPVVKALRNGAWQPVVVATGVSDGQYTEIKTGLQKGETVQVVPNPLAAATRRTH